MADAFTEITTSWKGELTFIATNSAGGSVQMGSLDGQPGVGPMQLLLAGLAGCTAQDIVSILEKKRIHLDDLKIIVRGRRAVNYPMVWEEIQVEYLLWGESIPAKAIEQAIQLSEEKYCCVGIMLGKSAKITSEYRLLKFEEIPTVE